MDRITNDVALSKLLKECKKNWLTTGIKVRHDEYLLQTACVIKIGWKVMKAQGMKPIGRRRGWVRSFIKVAENNIDYLSAINEKYEMVSYSSENLTSSQLKLTQDESD